MTYHRLNCADTFTSETEYVIQLSVVLSIIYINFWGGVCVTMGTITSLSNQFIKWKVISILISLHRKCQFSGSLSVLILVCLQHLKELVILSLLRTFVFLFSGTIHPCNLLYNSLASLRLYLLQVLFLHDL